MLSLERLIPTVYCENLAKIYVYIPTYIHITYIHTSTYVRTFIYLHTYVHAYILYAHAYIRTYIHKYIHTYIHCMGKMSSRQNRMVYMLVINNGNYRVKYFWTV
jgi:hypothetical protein